MPTPNKGELSLILNLAGQRVLIAGGGKVAAQKLKALPAGCTVRVIAPKISIKKQGVTLVRRKVRLSDVDAADIIFAATDDARLNAALARRAKGKLVSVADAPELGNFTLPAVARVGLLKISVSSSGASPALSKALRQWLEKKLRASKLPALAAILGKRRAWLKAHPEEKKKLLGAITNPRAFSRLLS